MPKFTHLHVHSHYSLLDGLPKIDQLLDYVKELGMNSVAITDHGVLYGAIEFYQQAKKRDIKPIIGCEIYLAREKMENKRPNIDNQNYHLVLLAKNELGYKNLVKLVTKAHLEGFYYKPRIDEQLLEKYSQGLIGLSACLKGRIPQLILEKQLDQAEKSVLKYQQIFGKGNFYLELQHHPNLPDQKKANQTLISLSRKLNIPLVATNDCHYLKPEDAEAQDILMLINTGADKSDPERLSMIADDFSIRTPEKMREDFKDIPEAIDNTQKIADSCNLQFEFGKTRLPYYPLPEGKTADQQLSEICYQRLGEGKIKKTKQVLDRLEYELSAIKKTGFASYFLIVQDLVNWAKKNRIVVGPGRGSVGGSLVAYVLNITNVDPLKYNLLFERFINPARVSPPDIDLDFTDRRRDEVIEYVSQKYGADKVAQIITFGTMAARAAIRDVGRALDYPYSYCDQVAKMIPFGFSLDNTLKQIKEFSEIYQQDPKAQRLINLAKKLEGVARHASTHACGVVISDEPLQEIVPLQHPTQSEEIIVTQYEMHAIEDLGLLKMDFLGLKNLTIIEDTLKMIYAIRGKNINIEKIPLDDKKVYKLLQNGQTVGIFQLESDGMRRYLQQLKPTGLEDIIAMIALYRPGPIQFIPEYIARKHGKKKVEYLHPLLKPVLESTQGICIYQEELMQIAQKLAGFSLSEADILRKAVGKKIQSLLIAQKEKFIQGTIKNKVEKQTAQKIWEWILPFARYGFNRSHSCAYALIAYQTAYLKAHYPLEFMASLLTSERGDTERVGFLIEECKKMNVEVLPPDINESFWNFSAVSEKGKIRFGLLAIKNVGQNIVETIVKERKERGKYKSTEDFISRVGSKDLNKKSLEALIKAGAFDKFGERNHLLTNLDKLLDWLRESQKAKNNGQRGLFDKMDFSGKLRLIPASPATKNEKLKWEKELLGLYVTSHPLTEYEKILEKNAVPIAKINEDLSGSKINNLSKITAGQRIKIGGLITNVKKIITKTGKPMLFLKIEDLTGKMEVVVFPSIFETIPFSLREDKIIFITGRTDLRDNVPKIVADQIEEIQEQ